MDNNRKNNDDKNKRPKWMMALIIALVAMVVMSFLSRTLLADRAGGLSYSEFLDILETKNVKSVTFNGREISDWRLLWSDLISGGRLVFEME